MAEIYRTGDALTQLRILEHMERKRDEAEALKEQERSQRTQLLTGLGTTGTTLWKQHQKGFEQELLSQKVDISKEGSMMTDKVDVYEYDPEYLKKKGLGKFFTKSKDKFQITPEAETYLSESDSVGDRVKLLETREAIGEGSKNITSEVMKEKEQEYEGFWKDRDPETGLRMDDTAIIEDAAEEGDKLLDSLLEDSQPNLESTEVSPFANRDAVDRQMGPYGPDYFMEQSADMDMSALEAWEQGTVSDPMVGEGIVENVDELSRPTSIATPNTAGAVMDANIPTMDEVVVTPGADALQTGSKAKDALGTAGKVAGAASTAWDAYTLATDWDEMDEGERLSKGIDVGLSAAATFGGPIAPFAAGARLLKGLFKV